MRREIREKRHKLYQDSVRLRDCSNEGKGEHTFKIREKQDEVYKKWKFYDEIIKANDKINKNN